jgi:hypothetical protein
VIGNRRIFCVPLALAVLLSGCKEKNSDAIEHLRGDFAAKREQLASLAKQLPPLGSVTKSTLPSRLTPPISHDAKGSGAVNSELLMAAQVANPDVVLQSPQQVDLLLGDELITCLQWTGPNNPMASSTLSARHGESIEKDCRAALGYRYLVALRPSAYARPVAVDERHYAQGKLDLEGFLFDLSSSKLLGAFHVSAVSADAVTYAARKS